MFESRPEQRSPSSYEVRNIGASFVSENLADLRAKYGGPGTDRPGQWIAVLIDRVVGVGPLQSDLYTQVIAEQGRLADLVHFASTQHPYPSDFGVEHYQPRFR
jgi:hypothetical protein